MQRFANTFIVLFLLDAGLSLVDELLTYYGAAFPLLTGVRFLVATAVVLLAIVFYACLGVDRRLPKRIFLPLTLYAFWCSVGMWPFSSVVGHDALGIAASLGQVMIGGFAIVLLHGLYGRILLPAEVFDKDLFSLANTLGFTIINLLLAPAFLVYTSLAMTGFYLEEQTAGFMRLSPVGIYMAERSYHLGGKEVRLAGMMHIGKEDYYEELAESMSGNGTIILAEGVSDEDGLLEHPFGYNRLAEVIGLTSQETMRLDGNLVDLESLGSKRTNLGETGKPDIVRADIDLNLFNPVTVEFLNALGRTLLSEQPLGEAFIDYNSWVEENMTPEEIAGVMDDIIDKRNTTVIDNMTRTLDYYDTVIIPWGAMHMPAIESAVLAKGFRPAEKQERLSLDFRAVPYAELWQKLSGERQ